VRSLSAYADAVAAIDAANAEDPNLVVVRGRERPLALAHGELASAWIAKLVTEPDEALLLAARAHHLRRWEVPRTSYPQGRPAYLRWRKDQKARHAADVEQLLLGAGCDPQAVARVQSLLRREHLATDADTQALEDAACLVFIETQLAEMAPKLEHEHLLEVIRKTALKMTPAGLAAVATMDLGPVERRLLAAAIG
jgi:hypothetical protein